MGHLTQLPPRHDVAAIGIPEGALANGVSRHVLLTSVSSDAHTWNLVFIQLTLEAMGHRVTNLGACTPDDEIVGACKRLCPDLVVVSSVNGHGGIDGERMITRIRSDALLRRLPVVIGGQLSVGGAEDHSALASRLLDAGFDAVFQPSGLSDFQAFVAGVSCGGPNQRRMEVQE